MIKIIKWSLVSILSLILLSILFAWYMLNASLPTLDGQRSSPYLSAQGSIERDSIGNAIVTANNRNDAAFLLGFTHAQDRYFQMDMLRRSAAGELSEIIGDATLNMDKKNRFHQFRKRAEKTYASLPEAQRQLMQSYAKGANQALSEMSQIPFEYLVTQSEAKPWKPEESLLATYSMYLDLQGGQIERDWSFTLLKELYGQSMVDFLNLPSSFQAALDGSQVTAINADIPSIEVLSQFLRNQPTEQRTTQLNSSQVNPPQNYVFDYDSIEEPADIGSNNWAVTGKLTDTDSGLLSNDMHLALRVPPIWYRAQLNYQHQGNDITVTGVSLPGTPAVIVGSNGHIAWGFTNANLDNVEWIELDDSAALTSVTEIIMVKDVPNEVEYTLSEFGPVKRLNNKDYALAWVAHQDYGVNMQIAEMAHKRTVDEALTVSTTAGMPVQNLMVVDKQGNAAWKPTGAVTARTQPSTSAIQMNAYSELWQQQEQTVPVFKNPDHGRLWTANSRVISVDDLARFGNGGYALGARGRQIRDRLFDVDTFDEEAFYNIQLDNEARFLMSWHALLTEKLSTQPQLFAADLEALAQWQSCACASSVGYTLVRKFRSTVINQLVAPIETQIKQHKVSLRPLLRGIEPAIWKILQAKPTDWLPPNNRDYDEFLINAYASTKAKLLEQYNANEHTLAGLEWGKVNALKVKHPIASSLSPLKNILNMQTVEGFGDSYMPAVQAGSFGASQRLIVRPGDEDKAILTIPGGQSGHPLSKYYKSGFEDYAVGNNTPLLPSDVIHALSFTPSS